VPYLFHPKSAFCNDFDGNVLTNSWPSSKSKSRSKSHYDGQSVGQSGTRGQFSFLHKIFFRQLWDCYFVAPSLTRGRVCNLLLLLVLASAVRLGSALSDERSGLYFVSLLSVSVCSQSECTYVIYIR
jgi:hypothetical protein